jgi:hypothetical protein
MQNVLNVFNINMIICHFASESLLRFSIFPIKVSIKTQESKKRQISLTRMTESFIKYNILAPCTIELVKLWDCDVFYWSGKIKLDLSSADAWSWKRGVWKVYDQSSADLLIRFINKLIEKHPSLLPECKATQAYGLTMPFCRSVRSPY